MGELMPRRADQPMAVGPLALGDAAAVATRRSRELESWELEPLRQLGKLLETARTTAGLTVQDLGPVAGGPSSLRSIERGVVRTRASRLRPWLERLGVDPDPVIDRFREVLAPERPDGRNAWKPVAPVAAREPRGLTSPPLEAYDQAALGAELWRLRVGAGLRRSDLARRLEISRIKVWLVERGQRQPATELLERWVDEVASRRVRVALALRFPGQIRMTRPRAVSHTPPDQSRHAPTGRFVPKNGDLAR